ncbi:MAG TPA: ABC transporter ATP-binding protein [Thiobacillaceae bacterium]|nr:ABC transporter ATP-binding protein [Thiobacillaceae bacterium]
MGVPCAPALQIAATGQGRPAIEVKDLVKRFKPDGSPALSTLTLTVPHNVIYGILGPNGAGKTTLLSILCGLLKPTSGSVRVGGLNMPGAAAEIKHLLGVVPQEPALYPTLTARENLTYYGRMQNLTGSRLEERVQACLDLAQIGDQANTSVEHFSGGFKRRLNLVIGLIHEPQILILDEPTVAIDPQSRLLIHQRLRELHAAGVTILLSTHYMDEAEQLCHDVAIMNRGQIVIQGGVQELLGAQRDEVIQIRLDRDPPPGLSEALGKLHEVGDLSLSGRCLRATGAHTDLAALALMQALKDAGVRVESMGYGGSNLEQIFLQSIDGDDRQ